MKVKIKIVIVDNVKPIFCDSFEFDEDLKWIKAYTKKCIHYLPIDKILCVTVGTKQKKRK